jgi:hypothetical protein
MALHFFGVTFESGTCGGVLEVVRLPRHPLRPRPRPPPHPPAVPLLSTTVEGVTVSLIVGGVSWVLEINRVDQKKGQRVFVSVERCFQQALRKQSSFLFD